MSATATTAQKLKQGKAKFWIVLVGVNRYLDSNIINLKYCANDCKELTDALKLATGQFQDTKIISLYDGGNLPPERSQIINSIQQFRFAKPEDTVLFYFSGHGYLDTNNRPVLCVADTRLDNLTETGLKLDFLLNELSQCQAQRQLVWLDACQEREQQPDTQIKNNPTQQLSAALKEQAEKSQNFHAMLSCDKQERSWEIEELQHGLFTFCLIEGLRGKAANSKGQIDADGLFNYVERITSRIIEDKKNPGDETLSKGMMINVQQIKQSSPPPKTKRLPANASQTPQRIVKGGGELVFLIGLAAPTNNRQALIINRLSNSEANIGLCKLLQAQGNFTVEYRYLRDKQQWQLQQDITRYLAADNRTVLLYLSGTIESTGNKAYELVCDWQHRINLNWLALQLAASSVREIVIIADLVKSNNEIPSLESILKLDENKPLCLIPAYSATPSNREFLHQLVTILESAGKAEREFWVTSLITQLQKWSSSQHNLTLKPWLSPVTGVIEILSVEVQRSHYEIFDIEVCPYKSLEAFTQDDAYFFHGREELITKIIEKLKTNSFLTVVGASGSGKSSVVRAGVVPKLLADGLNTSQSQQIQSCKTWVMLPGDNPFTALARAISPNEPKLIEGVLHAGVKGFVDWLRQQPQAISVLAIDQFEELFTLTPEKERIDFIKLIIAALERAGDCFKVIITLRGDFINECLNLSEIAPLMEQNEILLPVKSSRLEDEQYRQIIAQPAQKVGLEVESGLMAILLEELKDGSLPLLQYALEELWQKRSLGKLTLKDYQQHIGRLGQFLSDKAEATYKNLNQLQQECARAIFLSLVYLAQEQDKTNKDTRRRLLKSDLRVNKYKDTLDDTLQALVDARLIVVSGENHSSLATDGDRHNALAIANEIEENTSNQDTVEIAHEILINNWQTLEGWLKDNRDKYCLIREINQKAKDWKQNDQQEGFLLPKGALAKYEEFYIKYADEFPQVSDRFMDANIKARDEADKLAKRRQSQFIGGLAGGITVLTIALIMFLRSLELLQPFELKAFDWLMRIRPNEGIDPRFLIVEATEADINRFDYPLSDDILAQAIKQIEKYQPRVIGLQIFRDRFTKSDHQELLSLLQNNNRLIALCRSKINNEGYNQAGTSSSSQFPLSRLGFSTIDLDKESDREILRRQLIFKNSDPNDACPTEFSFSSKLALQYLKAEKVEPESIDNDRFQIGDTIFKRLQGNSGGYQNLDNRGFQLLLNYRSSEKIAETVSLTDVLNEQFNPDLVKDRVVIVGVVAPISNPTDYFSTPYSKGILPKMSGVYVQTQMTSQILSAVLDGRPLLTTWSKSGEIIWIFIWSVAGSGLAIACTKNRNCYWLIPGLGIGLWAKSYLALFAFGLWLPLVPGAIAFLTSSVGGSLLLDNWNKVTNLKPTKDEDIT